MKRLIILFLFLTLAATVFARQAAIGPEKSKPNQATVDCSTVDDAAITADVKARLAKSKSLKDLGIEVSTSQGEVTLTGAVKNGGQKGAATRLAKAVACVKKVTNQLKVEGATKAPK